MPSLRWQDLLLGLIACSALQLPIISLASEASPPGWSENPNITTNKYRGPVCRGGFAPRRAPDIPPGQVRISATAVEKNADYIRFGGKVRVIAEDLSVLSEEAVYELATRRLLLRGGVQYDSSDLIANSAQAIVGSAVNPDYLNLSVTSFSQPLSGLHGTSSQIIVNQSIINLNDAVISFCEPGENTWYLSGKAVRLNLMSRRAVVRAARFHLAGRPVLYLPYLPLPLGEERLTGFLFPQFGYRGNSGFIYSQPFYWNIAPNVDSTIETHIITSRGLLWEQELRWLTRAGRGTLGFGYIYRDAAFGSSRNAEHFSFDSNIFNGWSGEVAWTGLSDNRYVDDLPHSLVVGDLTVPRYARLRYASKWVDWQLGLRDFQLIADARTQFIQPYSNLPYMSLNLGTGAALGFYLENKLDYTTFSSTSRGDTPHAAAVNLVPGSNLRVHNELTAGWQGWTRWGQLQLLLGWELLNYDLSDAARNRYAIANDEQITTNNYYGTLDSSLTFGGKPASCHNCYLSFEPRLYFLAARQQRTAAAAKFRGAVFDTSPTPINYDYLFRPQRYNGFDSDVAESRVSLGLESRLINAQGVGFYKLRLGQIVYNSFEQSGFANNFTRGYPPWALDLAWHYGAGNFLRFDLSGQSELDSIGLAYRYADGKKSGVSVIYRHQLETFYQNSGDQLANNFVWYVAPRWSLFSGWRYKLNENRLSNLLLGFGYENCCFAVQTAFTRRLVNGRPENGVGLRFTFSPLATLGDSSGAGFATLNGGRISDLYAEFD